MSRRIRTLCLEPDTALASGAIEAGIRPLVDALLSSGQCQTIASCQGHGDVMGGPWIHGPYVMFRTSLDFARALQNQLDPGLTGRSAETHYHWSLEAAFHRGDYELAWTLRVHTICLPEFIARRRLNTDVFTIVGMVQQAAAGPLDNGAVR